MGEEDKKKMVKCTLKKVKNMGYGRKKCQGPSGSKYSFAIDAVTPVLESDLKAFQDPKSSRYIKELKVVK